MIAVRASERYYYALILDRVRLFGGHWVYAFHRTSCALLSPDAFRAPDLPGFHAFVDFIWAKRENRITRLVSKADTSPYRTVQYLKQTFTTKGKAALWFIYDLDFQEVKRVTELMPEERAYPDFSRIDDTIMVARIDEQWTPAQDARL